MNIQGTRNKRGIIEAQLTWVFILIVGVIILLFFVGIAQKQKQISDTKNAAEILQQLDGILTGAEVSTGTASLVNIPKLDIELTCDAFTIEGVTKQLDARVVFGPDLIQGRQLVMYNLDWSVPYRVTNFLYLTSPNVRYVLVGEAEQELESLLPEYITYESIPTSDNFTDKKNYKVRFVFWDKQGNIPDVRGDISAVSINDNSASFNNGLTWSPSIAYEGDAFKVGAVFAENSEQFNCTVKKAEEKKRIVTELYQDRINLLKSKYSAGEACRELLDINLTAFYDLESRNYDLQLQSCPTIY